MVPHPSIPHRHTPQSRIGQLIPPTGQRSLNKNWPGRHQMETQKVEIIPGRLVPFHAIKPSTLPLPAQGPMTPPRPTRLLQMEPFPRTLQPLDSHIHLGRSHPPSLLWRQGPGSRHQIPNHSHPWPHILPQSQHCAHQGIHSQRNLESPQPKPDPSDPGQSQQSDGIQADAQQRIRPETIRPHH